MADQTPKSYHTDPNLYLYTSLTAGSSQITTATSRMETILKANKIHFQALDVATDEKARSLWGRRAGKRKLPGLVRMGMIVGDLEEVEEWNEYGELRENVEPGSRPAPSTPATPSKTPAVSSSDPLSKAPTTNPVTPAKPPPIISSTETPPRPTQSTIDSPLTTAMRQAGFEAAKKAGDAKSKARAEALQSSKARTDTLNTETLQKLDNAGPTGMPPPSGTTDAVEAMKPETGSTSAEGRADNVPVTEEGEGKAEEEGETDGKEMKMGNSKEAKESANKTIPSEEAGEVVESRRHAEPTAEEVPSSKEIEEAANASIMHDKSHIVFLGSREGDTSEIVEETTKPNTQEEKGESKLKEATSVSDAGQGLPGEKTQDQPAASGEEAGNSVAD